MVNKILSLFDFILKIVIFYFIIFISFKREVHYYIILIILGLISMLFEAFMIKKINLSCNNKVMIICFIAKLLSLILTIIAYFVETNFILVLSSLSIFLFLYPMELLCYQKDYKLRYILPIFLSAVYVIYVIMITKVFNNLFVLNIIMIIFMILYEFTIYKDNINKNKKIVISSIIIHFIIAISACFIYTYSSVKEELKNPFLIGIMLVILCEHYFLEKLKDKGEFIK